MGAKPPAAPSSSSHMLSSLQRTNIRQYMYIYTNVVQNNLPVSSCAAKMFMTLQQSAFNFLRALYSFLRNSSFLRLCHRQYAPSKKTFYLFPVQSPFHFNYILITPDASGYLPSADALTCIVTANNNVVGIKELSSAASAWVDTAPGLGVGRTQGTQTKTWVTLMDSHPSWANYNSNLYVIRIRNPAK